MFFFFTSKVSLIKCIFYGKIILLLLEIISINDTSLVRYIKPLHSYNFLFVYRISVISIYDWK